MNKTKQGSWKSNHIGVFPSRLQWFPPSFEVVFKFADLVACLSWLKQFVFSGEKVDNIEAIHHDMFLFCQDSPFRVYKYIRYANEF